VARKLEKQRNAVFLSSLSIGLGFLSFARPCVPKSVSRAFHGTRGRGTFYFSAQEWYRRFKLNLSGLQTLDFTAGAGGIRRGSFRLTGHHGYDLISEKI
jgi:hypothetical protein